MGIGLDSLITGGLGYLGVKETNQSNEGIASARNVMEREEALKAREFSADQAELNRNFQAQQVAKQMGFQERMSSTAVQRRMKDLKAAGINPILAGKFDASSPAGGAGSGSPAPTAKANAHGYTAQNKLQGALDNLSTAVSVRKLNSDTEKVNAETESIKKGLPKKGFFEQLWEPAYKDLKTFKNNVDKYQNSALKGKGMLDKADAMLEDYVKKSIEEYRAQSKKTPPFWKDKKQNVERYKGHSDPGGLGYDIPTFSMPGE